MKLKLEEINQLRQFLENRIGTKTIDLSDKDLIELGDSFLCLLETSIKIVANNTPPLKTIEY